MTEAQIDKCRGKGFIPLPKWSHSDRTHAYYECPFCEDKHYATIAISVGVHDVRPIHCHITGQVAWVRFITESISQEEEKFFNLLDTFKGLLPMSSDEAVTMWHSKGLPYELAEELSDDVERFRELAESHRAKSK